MTLIPRLATPLSTTGKRGESQSALSKVLDKSREDQLKVFEKMFLAQIRHQDPLNPMSTNDLTQNIMTFHTAAQQSQMNEVLGQINQNHLKLQTMTAKGYLNKDVDYHGNEFTFEGERQDISFVLPGNLQEAVLTITNTEGEHITSFPLSTEPGKQVFSWDGRINGEEKKAPEDQYHVSIVGKNKQEEIVPIPPMLKGIVRQVGYHEESNDFAFLVNNTPIRMSDISGMREPPSPLTSFHERIEEQMKRYQELNGYLKEKRELEPLSS